MVVRIGMISFAHLHAHSYAACLRQLPDRAELVGIFDEDPERGKSVCQDLETPFFDSCDHLLSQDIDGVIICTENAAHRPYTEKAAQAGKHVLCEKPISVSIEDAQAMIDTCEAHQVQLMTAFPCRFSTPINRGVELVRKGKLGKILALKGTNQGTMPGGWFIDKNQSGGGAVMDHTVHIVDVWRWMLGCEVVSVYAESGQLFYPGIDIDDTGLLSLEFEGGIFATLDTSWSRPNASFPTWGGATMEIIGEKGTITLDAFQQHINIYNNTAIKAEWESWADNIDLGLIKSFITMIKKNEPSPIPGIDGLRAMEVALGAYRSVQTNQPVALPLD